MVGGALCGIAGAYISVVYTPLWVEGMVAGKGWIALALTTFATWRPARVLLGAYLFGGVTMLQFHLQGAGVQIPSQFLTMLPYLATILVLVLISRNPTSSASTCRLRSASRSSRQLGPRSRLDNRAFVVAAVGARSRPQQGSTHDARRNAPDPAGRLGLARRGGRAGRLQQEGRDDHVAHRARRQRRAGARCRRVGAPLKIAFAYVGPVGDGGWTFAHDNGRKAMEKEFGAKVQTSFVEKVPEAADAERVFRDMVSQGNTLIFGTTFGYMEPMLKVANDNPDVKFEHATGYKTAANMRTYDSAHVRRRVHGRRDRGRHDEDATRWASSARSRSPRWSATSTASRSARSR